MADATTLPIPVSINARGTARHGARMNNGYGTARHMRTHARTAQHGARGMARRILVMAHNYIGHNPMGHNNIGHLLQQTTGACVHQCTDQ